MSINQAMNASGIRAPSVSKGRIDAFDLLGQGAEASEPVRLARGSAPALEIAWGNFRQSFWSSFRASLAWMPGRSPSNFFSGSLVEPGFPRRALIAAALWHLVFLVMPFPRLSVAPPKTHAFDNTELTWSGPIEDLPLLAMRADSPKRAPRGEPSKPQPALGADAFHPRQRIFTDPVRPNHPRQMLVNTAAPALAPKFLPNLPNIVQFAAVAVPARPQLAISAQSLAQLHPRERQIAAVAAAPLPDIANAEPKPSELPLAASLHTPARPKLEINAGVVPRVAPRKQTGDLGPAPDLAAQAPPSGPESTLVALSATPGPVAPVKPPEGNLAARLAISPEGKKPGIPGGAANAMPANGGTAGDRGSVGGSSGGPGNAESSISGGNPAAKSGMSGLGGPPKLNLDSRRPKFSRADLNAAAEDTRTGPPNFAALAPGAKPEQLLGGKRVYTLYVNMPNLNSASGSWVLNFSELRIAGAAPRNPSGEVASPEPIRKVDPKYPPALAEAHVQGEVVLYAVIRSDGSVDSIQVVRGLDDELDHNAVEAFAQWKFRPAERDGVPVSLEVIAHIPFHPRSAQ
jgi:TonB family protein